MAVEVIIDGRLWVNAYDLSGHTNELAADCEAEVLDFTNFDSAGWRESKRGLKQANCAYKGFLDFADDASHEALSAAFGANNVISTAVDDAHGADAQLCQVLGSRYSKPFKVGQLPLFDVAFVGATTPGLVDGKILVPKSAVSSGGSGTGLQLGAVSATQRIYAALHVFACTGTLTCTLVSDDNDSFSSATTRATFTAATGQTVEWTSVAGAITDDYWRINYSLPSGTASFAVTAGIV